jgi:hypothetical protein
LEAEWFAVVILNVHAPTYDENDALKNIPYKELKHFFDKFTEQVKSSPCA